MVTISLRVTTRNLGLKLTVCIPMVYDCCKGNTVYQTQIVRHCVTWEGG